MMRVYLEITNVCNRKCSFCPGTKRTPMFILPERFAERLKKLSGTATELCLHILGEPLLHPQFSLIVNHCSAAGIPVNLTTNGTLLDRSMQELLLNAAIFRQINFSLQALSAEETAELDRILDFCDNALQKRPELYLNLRLWNLNSDFSRKDANTPFLERIRQRLDLPERAAWNFSPGRKSLRLKGWLYLNCDSQFEWPVKSKETEDSGRAFCHGLETQFGILVDGTVVPCCLDSEGTAALGSIDSVEDVKEILNGPKARAIAEGFARGQAVADLCRKCTFRRRF